MPIEISLPQTEAMLADDAHVRDHLMVLEEDLCCLSLLGRCRQSTTSATMAFSSWTTRSWAMQLINSVAEWLESLPDTFVTKNNDKFLMVWPKDPDVEVKLRVLPVGESATPTMIKTGSLSEACSCSLIMFVKAIS
jgi:hypothetical protein